MKWHAFVISLIATLAVPASAQFPGSAPDVYDANGQPIGAYVGRSGEHSGTVKFDVALEHDGEHPVVSFHQDRGGSGFWGAAEIIFFALTPETCAGTPYLVPGSSLPLLAPDTQGGFRTRARSAFTPAATSPSSVPTSTWPGSGSSTATSKWRKTPRLRARSRTVVAAILRSRSIWVIGQHLRPLQSRSGRPRKEGKRRER